MGKVPECSHMKWVGAKFHKRIMGGPTHHTARSSKVHWPWIRKGEKNSQLLELGILLLKESLDFLKPYVGGFSSSSSSPTNYFTLSDRA